jgi:uncharacterized phage protein (TIGR01671 family)
MKYRVYNVKDDYFFKPEDCLMDGNGDLVEPKPIGFYDCFEIDRGTGIKDANKKQIFENDIVSYDDRDGLAVVKYDNEDGSFYLEGEDLTWIDVFADKRRWYRCEVVGNIHQNSDLLKP